MQVPAIIRKDRHHTLPQNALPTNNHHSIPTETCWIVRFFTENARVRIRGFSKIHDRVAEDFKKNVMGLRRIFFF